MHVGSACICFLFWWLAELICLCISQLWQSAVEWRISPEPVNGTMTVLTEAVLESTRNWLHTVPHFSYETLARTLQCLFLCLVHAGIAVLGPPTQSAI